MTNEPAHAFPLADFLEMVTGVTGPGVAMARLNAGPKHLNPHGTVHGAVLFAMADTAMGAATMNVLESKQLCASIDVQLRFCKPAFGGELVATTTVVQQGKRVIQLQGDIRDSGGSLIALASGSFAVIDRTREG